MITFIHQGKTNDKVFANLEHEYIERLKHYCRVDSIYLPDVKSGYQTTPEQLQILEGIQLLFKIKTGDLLYLFDERGKTYSSVDFANFIQKQLNTGAKNLILATGGAFGFSKEVYQRANGLISLSPMTFTHLMVRAIIAEQVYRAFTILRNEKYHH
jgi:23S rRNA (pseudouridine1915-N3)-methyltransferase